MADEYENKEAFLKGLKSTRITPEARDLLARISDDPKYREQLETFADQISSLTHYYLEHKGDFSREEKEYINSILARESNPVSTIIQIVAHGATERLRKASARS